MAFAVALDGTRLVFEVSGAGEPLLLYHRQLKIRFSYFDDSKIVDHQTA
jgi:hypothetical protein